MINIIGILILITGFILPYPMDMRLPSTYSFWVGGLLTLQKGILIRGEVKWAKWAQIGILIHIATAVVSLLTHYLIGYGSITTFECWIYTVLYWLSSPGTSLAQQLFPYPETHHPDGSVCFQIGYIRMVITSFLNVVIFAFISALIGIFWQKRIDRKEP